MDMQSVPMSGEAVYAPAMRVIVNIAGAADVTKAHQAVLALCRTIGLGRDSMSQVSAGVDEMAGDLLRAGGRFVIRTIWRKGCAGLEITAENAGQYAQAGKAVRSGKSLLDECEVKLSPTGRIRVVARKWGPQPRAPYCMSLRSP